MSNIITLPDLSHRELVWWIRSRFPGRNQCEDLYKWDFTQPRDQRLQDSSSFADKRFEVLTLESIKISEYAGADEVTAYFDKLDADGCNAAFLVWIMENHTKLGMEKQYLTIPKNPQLRWIFPTTGMEGFLYYFNTIYFQGLKEIGVSVLGEYKDRNTYVAFRELK